VLTNDLASLNGRPRLTLRVAGDAYAVHPLTLAELGDLQSWVDAQFRDPIDLVRGHLGAGLTMAQEQFLLRAALEIASRPRALIGTPEADALLRSADGQKRMLLAAIRKGRPDFAEADADRLFAALTPFELAAAFEAAGVEAAMGDPSPKAGAGGGTPTTPATPAPPSTGGASTTAA
jgi:hypothetical protein